MNKDLNPVGWFEIYVSDLDRAKAFYEAVLDVKLEQLPLPAEGPLVEMWSFPMLDNTQGACGAICKMDGVDPGTGGTMIYFSCEDCAADQARVEGAGGQVVRPKFSIGEYGFISIVIDTEGNTIGLHSPN